MHHLPKMVEIMIYATFSLSSVNILNLAQSKNLSFHDKDLEIFMIRLHVLCSLILTHTFLPSFLILKVAFLLLLVVAKGKSGTDQPVLRLRPGSENFSPFKELPVSKDVPVRQPISPQRLQKSSVSEFYERFQSFINLLQCVR